MRPAKSSHPPAVASAMVNRIARAAVKRARRHWRQGLVALHLVKMVFWFRDVNPFSGFPLTNVDYVQFYGRALRIHEFLERSGRIWGYDPFDMAGYISGPFHEVGTHALAMAAHFLAPLLPMSLTMLIIEVAALVAVPFLVFPVMRILGFQRTASWIAFGVTVLTFGVVEPFSIAMYKIGLWGFMVSGFVSLLQVALLYRWIERRDAGSWAAFTVVSALVFQIHPAALVVLIAPNAVLYAYSAKRLGFRGAAALALTAAVILAANWYWISSFLAFSHWRTTAPYYMPRGIIDVLDRFGPIQPDVFKSIQAIVNCSSVVLAWIALRETWKTRPLVARTIAVWIVFLFIISYFGMMIPWIRTLQPGRNEFVMFLLLYLMSSTVIESRVLASRRPRIVGAVLLPALIAFMFEMVPGDSPWSKFAPPLRTELMAWQDMLIQNLRTDGAADGRVLLECADDLNPNFADVVPELTGAVLLGGQHPGNFLAAQFTLFSGDRLVAQGRRSLEPFAFNRNLVETPEEEFAAYLDMYNVTRVIARTPSMIEAMERMDQTLELIEEVRPHRIYRVKNKSTWFRTGTGTLSMDYDKVTIDGASKGVIVPKVHWFDTFVSSPAVPIRAVFIADDPVPFLEIDNGAGHARIEITNGGLPGPLEIIRRRLRREKPW